MTSPSGKSQEHSNTALTKLTKPQFCQFCQFASGEKWKLLQIDGCFTGIPVDPADLSWAEWKAARSA
jgi:hypothetical protein